MLFVGLMDSQTESGPEAVVQKPQPPKKKSTRSRCRKKDGDTEHGNNWAKGKHREFLEKQISEHYVAGDTKTWESFYERVVDAWVAEGFKLEDIGKSRPPVCVPGEEEAYKLKLRARAKNVS